MSGEPTAPARRPAPSRASLPEWSIRHRRAVLAAVAGLCVLSGFGLARLRVENPHERYFPASAPERSALERLERQFGRASALRVLVPERHRERSPRSVSEAEDAAARDMADLERRFAALPGVREVVGRSTAWPLTAEPASGAGLAPSPREPESAVAPIGPLAEAVGFAAPGGESSFLLVVDPADEAAVLERAESLARALGRSNVAVVGLASLSRALDASGREAFRRSLPLLLALAAALLVAIFRHRQGIVAPLGFVGWVLTATLGLLGALGPPVHLVLSILPPLLLVISLATAVHVATRARDLVDRRGDLGGGETAENAAIAAAFREKGPAILWTTLASGAGFGSLAASPVRPVSDLGIWSAVGLAMAGLSAFVVLPALLATLAPRPRPRSGAVPALRRPPIEAAFHDLGCRVAEGAARRFRRVLWLAAAVATLALAGFPRLETQSNALRYLPPEHPARAAIERLDAQGLGSATVDLSISLPDLVEPGAPGVGRFDDGAGIAALRWWTLRLREDGVALRAVGAGDLVEEALRRDARGRQAAGGAAPRQAALEALRSSAEGRRRLEAWLAPDGRSARLALFLPTAGVEDHDRRLEAARRLVAEDCPDCAVEASGRYSLLLATQRLLLETLFRSLGVTLLVVTGILYLLLRRVRLTLLALVPNLLPILVVFGVMGWLGWPLDIATVMVGSTTLGLALDDTIHTLIPFRRAVGEGGRDAFSALLETVEANAAAYSATGVILFLGFAACALSAFAPIRMFGALSALSIALAVGADFLLVPALLGGAPAEVVRPKPSGAGDGGPHRP